ncbi:MULTISPECIES: DNA alkylation repair protein [unclassified Microbacterium]|uniref:DNA alkylation repair protein n=1 Tax=unclassified Microbacterium TaxID=2609290 RepID=UPI0022F0A7D7|nr:DNA alkylation repair protein [Streptomyces sp. MS2A]
MPDSALATLDAALAELAALEDPKARAVNERHGDAHGVNLTKMRALAKRIGTDDALGRELWASGDVAGQLLGLLLVRPRSFGPDDLDAMVRATDSAKGHDWFVNYIAKKSPHAEEMRERWMTDEDADARAAAWSLTTDRVAKKPEGLDLDALLDTIEAELKEAPARLQWAMNETLATIGIHHPSQRERAIAIGERLQVLADYPTPPNCTSPFAPIWIAEIVRRREG